MKGQALQQNLEFRFFPNSKQKVQVPLFPYVESSLRLWDEVDLVMVDDGSNVFLDSIC